MRKKKKFKDTVVGRLLGGSLGLINPALGSLVQGTGSIEDLLLNIKNQQIPTEDKIRAQELVVEAYEAEVNDRVAARQREATIAASGGSDILFKVIGFGITGMMILVAIMGLGLVEMPENINRDFLMFVSGSISSAFMAVVSYYFGTSLSSQKKTHIMNTITNEESK